MSDLYGWMWNLTNFVLKKLPWKSLCLLESTRCSQGWDKKLTFANEMGDDNGPVVEEIQEDHKAERESRGWDLAFYCC